MAEITIRGATLVIDDIRSWVSFDAGENGAKEAGRYFFWTAEGEDEFGPWKCTGRALDSLPTEDRFLRFEAERLPSGDPKDLHNSLGDRAIYQVLWQRLKSIKGVRAANYREVADWMAGHKQDAIYVLPNWSCRDQPMFGLPPLERV